MKGTTRWLSFQTFITVCCLLMLATGCKDLNDNPPPEQESKLKIDIASIQEQITASDMSQEESVTGGAVNSISSGDTAVSSEAKTLLVGAIVVTRRSTPYPGDTTPTTSITSFFGGDLTDSGDFLELIELPVSEQYIEFKVPPASAGNWQVFAVAFSTQPELISDLSAVEHKNSAIYYGTHEEFLNADDIGTTAIPVKMGRVCLLGTPPKGCASFGASLTTDPVVTASVEIIGVRANGQDYTPSSVDFPIFVRTAGEATAAIDSLKTIRDEIKGAMTATSMTVRATHTENTTESADCQALASVSNENELTNTQLRTHCEVSDYRVTY
jgi:hypothetical protein